MTTFLFLCQEVLDGKTASDFVAWQLEISLSLLSRVSAFLLVITTPFLHFPLISPYKKMMKGEDGAALRIFRESLPTLLSSS